MATKKKLDFDFSKFGCNEDAVKELTEAMGFEAKDNEGVYVSPLDSVKRRNNGEILFVVTRELQRLEFPNDSQATRDRYIPVVEKSVSGKFKVNGLYPEYLITLEGKKIHGFKD